VVARDTKPLGTSQHRFNNFYLYSPIARHSGDGYFLRQPKFNAALFQVFLNEFARARPHTLNA
jgi:hypothetical protein